MSTGSQKKLSLLAPIIDSYEPTQIDADRVFSKVQAELATAPSGTSKATSGRNGRLPLFGLSCVALALVGALALRTGMRDNREASTNDPPAAENAPESAPEIAPAPSSPSISVEALPSVTTAATSQAAKRHLPVPAPSTSAPAVAESDSLDKETRLLAEARRASHDGDGARALTLLDEHASSFPNGWLANERAAERVLVLCRLGRRDEAVRAANVFLEGRAKSPLTRRVEMSCAGQPATKAGE